MIMMSSFLYILGQASLDCEFGAWQHVAARRIHGEIDADYMQHRISQAVARSKKRSIEQTDESLERDSGAADGVVVVI